jgi:hypothetical protein
MGKEEKRRIVVVTGDITMDWNIASFRDTAVDLKAKYWASGYSSRAYWQSGGAVVVANLVTAVVKNLPKDRQYEIRQTATPKHEISPCDDRFHHTYTMWAPHKFCEKPPLDREKFSWRVERFLGFDHSTTGTREQDWHIIAHDDPDADLLVLDDSNLDFRDNHDLWPKALFSKQPKPWIILKMNGPLAQGKLWETLVNEHAEKLIVITPINDLRRTGVQISRHLSWERTAQDVVWELTNNPQVNGLSRCAAVIISFNTAGAILITWEDGHANASLLFDPLVMEDDFEKLYPGKMYGYTSCLAAAIARQVILTPDKPDLLDGVQRGVAAMRILHMEGYGTRGTSAACAELEFPTARIAEIIERTTPFLSVVSIQDPTRFLLHEQTADEIRPKRGYWTILEERYAVNLENVARQIVLEGFESALRNVPVGRFGALVNVDRREIEALHSIQRLIAEYCLEPQKKPLSIAVFGPPGSGKSFGVEQVAKSILSDISVINFNLSQFGQPEDLLNALHQVRDVSLSGKIPLVFWDEFDSALNGQPLGWLRYFISPMQDGAFQQGQISHPIGRCIFVFVGGTSHNMEEFGSHIEENRLLKMPDFISRLKGFLDILGPNPIEEGEQYHILRRAIVLRSILERNSPSIFHNFNGKKVAQIDLGVLRALLITTTYKHGVRSLESIIAMSTLAGKSAFERSSLPPEEQLKLHVEARNFLSLVQQIELEGFLLEKLAEAVHEIYCEGLIKRGYKYGPVTDEKKKILSVMVPYSQLSQDNKEMNRGNVRDIAAKLASVGYVMRPARSDQKPFNFPGQDIEKLARMEHARFVNQKLTQGWTYASQRDDTLKTSPAMVEWEKLPEVEKEKDRTMVRAIPAILARAGYAVEKL